MAISTMANSIRQLARYRELLYMITWRAVKVKYKQTILGLMWAVLLPLIIVAAGMFIRYAFSLLSKEPLTSLDLASVSVKAIPWAFFASSVRLATNSLISNTTLVTKIFMPREIFPIAAVLSQMVDFIAASTLLTVLLFIAQIGVSSYLVWVPVLVLFLILLTMGLGILLSAASLFFRDVKYIVDVLMTFAIFFTPVFYDAAMFGKWGNALMLNPVAPILEGLSDCIVHHTAPPLGWVLYSAIVSVATVVVAFSLFKKLEPAFAESI